MVAVKRSVSFDPEVWAAAEDAAGRQQTTLSALVNEALAEHLALQRGMQAMDQWQADHGAFTEAEIADADAIIDAALTPSTAPREPRSA